MDSFLGHQMLMLHAGFLYISGVGRSSHQATLSEMPSKVGVFVWKFEGTSTTLSLQLKTAESSSILSKSYTLDCFFF